MTAIGLDVTAQIGKQVCLRPWRARDYDAHASIARAAKKLHNCGLTARRGPPMSFVIPW
jgi:hypothetical protein